MEERLPPPRFLRIHRSFIVDCQRIEVIRKQQVVVGGTAIPVSDLYASVLYETLRLSGHVPGA
jgi:DNA-binding LytR/AlgR family response regulator